MSTDTLVELPELFRGDTCTQRGANAADKGRTFADHFLTNGLMAKFADGGNLAWFNLPLPYLVVAHIGYAKNTREEKISYRSPLLSFTRSLEEAWGFADRSGRKRFDIVPFADATHFAWKLSGIRARELSAGRFQFTYRASTHNVAGFRQQLEAELQGGHLGNFERTIATGLVHQHLDADDEEHVAELIDATAFLKANEHIVEDKALLRRALDFAERSSEWLLFPKDPMEDGRGFSAQFPPNKHLSVPVFARDVRAPSGGPAAVRVE